MASKPVVVSIQGDDSQLTQILAKALAQIQTFKAGTQEAGQGMARGFDQARASAALLGDDLGVRLNRHLRTVIASSEAMRGALSAAFGGAVAVGLFEAAVPMAEKLWKFITDADFAAAHFDRENKIFETLEKAQEKAKELTRELAIAMAPSAAAMAQLKVGFKAEDAEQAKLRIGTLKQELVGLETELARLNENPEFVLGRSIEEQEARIHEKQMQIAAATQASENAGTATVIAQIAARKAEAEAIEEVRKRLEKLRQSQKDAFEAANKLVSGGHVTNKTSWLADNPLAQLMPISGGDRPLASDMTPDPAVAAKYLQQFKDLQGWYDSTRTNAEKFRIEVTNLNAQFAGKTDSGSIDVYSRALQQLKDRYKDVNQGAQEMGSTVAANIGAALTFKESWTKALEAIAQKFAEVALQTMVFNRLASAFGGGSGILGSFFSGFGNIGHHEAGGFIAPRSFGWINEAGAELVQAGDSGLSVTPANRLGGHTIYQDFRGAVVSDDLLRRAEAARMFSATEERSVRRAVAVNQEIMARR